MANKRFPALPKVVRGAGGPIKVRLVLKCKGEGGKPAYGTWDAERRLIQIERGLPVAHKQRVFWHEMTHAALDDSGIAYLLSEEGNEAVCEALASTLVGCADPRLFQP